jgi:transcriptional regulator with XRE-family HTH domain
MATIGSRLRQAREELQKKESEKGGRSARPNRSQFAREIGISAAALSDLESGKSKAPSSETLLRIRDRGINPDYVMSGKGPRFTDHVEHHVAKQTILSFMDQMDADERQTVIAVAAAIVRKSPGSGNVT